MPTTFPTDRFDALDAPTSRVGAHRAEDPRLRPSRIVLWSLMATLVLVLIGIVGTLFATGRISFATGATSQAQAQGPLEPVVDPSYPVLVLNATPEEGLAAETREEIVAAGWAEGDVVDSAAAADFAVTTVYYPSAEHEAAARGLADVIGGASVAEDDSYQPLDDPATEDVDESVAVQLVVVLGLDHTAPAE